MRDNTLREQRKALRKAHREAFFKRRKRSGSVMAGLLLLCIGTLLLLRAFGVPFPSWLFQWPMIIIAFGLLAGAGNSFRDPGWVVICGVGTVFLLQKIWPHMNIYLFVWPILIIAVGLIIILAPRRRIWHARYRIGEIKEAEKERYMQQWQQQQSENQAPQEPQEPPAQVVPTVDAPETSTPPAYKQERKNPDNWLDVVTIFGNVKKLVYSKNFKGGDIVSIFGGAEINLTQADFNGSVVIEMVQIFSGAKLIVPPHWQIRSEMVAVFGGIEDKRPPQTNYDEDKVVILSGTTFFGGLEIKSY